MLRRALTVPLAALALAGCGVGTAPHSSGASLQVTRDFGAVAVAGGSQHSVPAGETALTLLQHGDPNVRSSHGRVQAIDDLAGAPGRAWSLFVNGIAPVTKPGKTLLNAGDSVWFDLRATAAAALVPAVVGQYPEPFTTGIGGQAYPTVLDCSADTAAACQVVSTAMNKVGVKVSDQALGGGSGQDSLALVVGTFADLRGVIAEELLQGGPSKSGVYARLVGAQGQVLELLNGGGQVVQTLRGSVGLIAASEQQSLNAPTWLITGTDVAGVQAAASALNQRALRDHYAVAVSRGKVIPLPVGP
jgi:hypothetical protein